MSFWKNKPLVITVILIIVLIVLLFATSGTASGSKTSIFGEIIKPFQSGLYKATTAVGDFFTRLFTSSDLAKENAAMAVRIEELEAQLADYKNIVAENERLKGLLNVKDSYTDYEILTAQVIGNTPGAWFSEFTINAGTNDGIEPNMIVLMDGGLLGRVLSCSHSYSKVISLIDSKSGVPALVERTRDTGVIKPLSSEAGMLEMSYLTTDADVVPGDKIVPSGLGGIYPKGIEIGYVIEVANDSSSDMKVIVQSNIDFAHVEEVVVIKQIFEEVEN